MVEKRLINILSRIGGGNPKEDTEARQEYEYNEKLTTTEIERYRLTDQGSELVSKEIRDESNVTIKPIQIAGNDTERLQQIVSNKIPGVPTDRLQAQSTPNYSSLDYNYNFENTYKVSTTRAANIASIPFKVYS